MTNLDQSCSSLPSQAGGSQDTHDLPDSQIPVWRRNGKFVNFFRSFIGQKPKERAVKTPVVFGAELTKLLADTGDEGETPGIIYSVGNNQNFPSAPSFTNMHTVHRGVWNYQWDISSIRDLIKYTENKVSISIEYK